MKPTKGAERHLNPAVEAAWRIGAWGMLFSSGVTILYLAPSLFMMQVYDRVLASQSINTLVLLSGMLVVALATLAILDGLRTRLLARISLRFERLVAPALLEAGLRASKGGKARYALREFDTLRHGLAGPGAIAVFDIIWSPVYFAVCFLIHPWLGALVSVGAGVLVLLAIVNERMLRRALNKVNEIAPVASLSQDAESAASDVIGALGMRGALVSRQLRRRAALNEAQKHALFGSVLFTTLVKFVRLVLQSSLLGFGAFLAVEGMISPGALIAASIIGGRALAPIEQVVSAWRSLSQMRAAFKVVRDVLDTEKVAPERITLPAPRGELRFENVSLRADGGEKWLLAGVSFVLRPGEVLGVLGHSGAGKSSLARVAVGALQPESGRVRLDGASLEDWDPDELGAHIGYLPQDVSLLEGSIAENIRRFRAATQERGEALHAETIDAGRRARAHELILSLPGGYGAQLGPFGRGVSMGQAQRIGLARALFGSPRLLVFDEPNAHLDAEGEAALIEAIKQERASGAAIMVVAHRAGVLAIADRLLVLKGGRVEHFGEREEVLRNIADARVQPGNLTPIRPRGAQT